MVVTDVAFSDQAVDSSLIGVSAVPQHSAVVETELVLRSWRESEETRQNRRKRRGGGRDLRFEPLCVDIKTSRKQAEGFSPSVRAVHVFLEPGLEVS